MIQKYKLPNYYNKGVAECMLFKMFTIYFSAYVQRTGAEFEVLFFLSQKWHDKTAHCNPCKFTHLFLVPEKIN